MERPFIPVHLTEITPDWLTEALRESGLLGGGRVRSLRRQVLGDGEGFMGVVARLTVEYEGDAEKAPRSLIVKLPTPIDENRIMGELMAAYWREIRFYEEYAEQVPVRTPRLFHAEFDPDPSREKQDGMVKVFDRLPLFVVNGFMALAKWAIGRRGHRYVLLLEDLEPAQPGDQVGGGSVERCRRVVREAARLHAAYWGKGELLAPPWIAQQDSTPRIRFRIFLDAQPAFRARYAALLDAGLATHVRWLVENGLQLSERLHGEAPHTLIHGDFRFDNLFFDSADDDADVIFADWQLVGRGAGAFDIAYLLTGALHEDVSAEHERSLLESYHRALVANGVEDYDFATCLRHYQRGLMMVLQIVSTTDAMDLGQDRGLELMDLWVARTFARLRNVDPEQLL